PDREPVRKAFREGHEVRLDAELLEGEERPRPAHAGLDLVQAEERVRLGGGEDEFRVDRMDAAFALDRLDQDQAGVVELRRVARLDEDDVREERSKGLALRGLARRGERAQRAAVKRALECDDLRLPRRLVRVLERSLVRLGPGVAEEGLRAGPALGERGGEPL